MIKTYSVLPYCSYHIEFSLSVGLHPRCAF